MKDNPNSKYDTRTLQEKQAELREDLELTILMAKRCYEHEDFMEYKKRLKSTKDALIDKLIKFSACEDFNKYAFEVKLLLGKIEALSLLLDEVEFDLNLIIPANIQTRFVDLDKKEDPNG